MKKIIIVCWAVLGILWITGIASSQDDVQLHSKRELEIQPKVLSIDWEDEK